MPPDWTGRAGSADTSDAQHLACDIHTRTDIHIAHECLTSCRTEAAAPAAAAAAAAAVAAAARISFISSSMACFLGWGTWRDGDPSRLLGLFWLSSSVFISRWQAIESREEGEEEAAWLRLRSSACTTKRQR
jgi:hypothetical protein